MSNENIITNGKFITIRNQDDLEVLQDFFEQMLSDFAESQGWGEPQSSTEFFEEGQKYSYYWIPREMPLKYVVDYGVALKAIEPDDIVEKPYKTTVNSKYTFGNEEMMDFAHSMAYLDEEIEQKEEERKNLDKQKKNEIAQLESKRKAYAQKINAGYELRELEVREVMDFNRGVKYYKAEDGTIVDQVPISEADNDYRQMKLPFEDAVKSSSKQVEAPDDSEEEAE